MPDWTASSDGIWTESANWSGGVPNGAGSAANFSLSGTTGLRTVRFVDSIDVRLGTLNVNSAGTALLFAGATGDSGTTPATLIFDNGASAAQLNVTFSSSSDGVIFTPSNGFVIRLDSDLIVNTLTAISSVGFFTSISGSGSLTKSGAGILVLSDGLNTYTGGTFVTGGALWAISSQALGSGAVQIENDAVFSGVGSISNQVGTSEVATGTAGSANITVIAGETMTLSGAFAHRSQGNFTFGSATDTGTIVANFSAVFHNPTNSSMRIAGGVVRIGSADVGNSLFFHPGTGLTEFTNGGVLDTNGFQTLISNLDFDSGTIRSSSGALQVVIVDVMPTQSFQSGTVEGTTGSDHFQVNAEFNFDIGAINFSGWSTAEGDTITLVGSAGANTLRGSAQRDQLVGEGGDDILFGEGGIDSVNGGEGNDRIILLDSNDGTLIAGGAGIDTLRVANGSLTPGAITGLEAIELATGTGLQLTDGQFASGFDPLSTVSGSGQIVIQMNGVGLLNARGLVIAPGSDIELNLIGTLGNDVIKGAIGARNVIFGGNGSNRLNGGDLSDTFVGGTGIDKVRGDAGADTMTGGTGADVFKFRSVEDSTTAAFDRITDFLAGTDKLNFSRIDTNVALGGDQAFTYIGSSAFVTSGTAQIRWVDLGADLRVEADIDGNGVADMYVLLQGAGTQTLTATDFVL